MFERVEEAAATIRRRYPALPEAAIVLGSGLGDVADAFAAAVTVAYADLPHWPAAKVVGHQGRLVIGQFGGRRVAALAGRVHLYEGHDPGDVVFAARVMGRLGARILVLTNAAGGINTAFCAGTLMVIDDHINLLGVNPLAGENDERFGPRFPDMTEVYSRRLRRLADEAAAARHVPVAHGIYAACLGPSYETPAEIRYLRAIGADAVGMSTVHETIVARHCGLRVAAVSAISNYAEGMSEEPVSHEQTLRDAARAAEDLAPLITRFVERSC